MKQTTCIVLLVSSLLYFEVTSDDSFLQMENLEIYTDILMKLYNAKGSNPELNVQMSIQNFFAKLKNFTNDLAEMQIDLRSDIKISFFSHWEVHKKIYDDLNNIITSAKDINEFFESYYVDFLDGFHTNSSILTFIVKTIYPVSDSLYKMTTKIKNRIFSQQLLQSSDDFFDRISDKLNENFIQLCKSHSTRQQFLTLLYSFIIKAQFRAFLMFTSAFKLNSIISNGSLSTFTMFINQLRTYFLSKSSFYLKKMQSALAKTSTEYYDCRVTHEYNYGIKNVYAIDLSPTIIDYKWNTVVTGVQFELRDGFLSLVLYDGKLLENGKISGQDWDSRKHFSTHRRPTGYTFPEDRKFDYKLSEVEYVDKSFWKNISFLHTKVPENHVIIGANFEVLKFDPNVTTSKKVLYLRLHYVKVNTTTGEIDTSKITHTKLWTKDDLELQQYPGIANDHSFENSVEAIYDKILFPNISDSNIIERWRRRPPLSSYIDSNIITVYPPLPITGIGLWKHKYEKNSNDLSLKTSTMDISSRINSRGKKYTISYSVRTY